MSKFKHLNLEDRITIESDLKKGLSFKKIGHDINHDCTTVSKEIKNHSTIVDDMWPTNRKHNRCIHYKGVRPAEIGGSYTRNRQQSCTLQN